MQTTVFHRALIPRTSRLILIKHNPFIQQMSMNQIKLYLIANN